MPPTILVDDDPAFRPRHRPEGVLFDINLPDHAEMCVSRTLTAQAGAPVIVLTSTGSSGLIGGCSPSAAHARSC